MEVSAKFEAVEGLGPAVLLSELPLALAAAAERTCVAGMYVSSVITSLMLANLFV